jgi:hypothetical protein
MRFLCSLVLVLATLLLTALPFVVEDTNLVRFRLPIAGVAALAFLAGVGVLLTTRRRDGNVHRATRRAETPNDAPSPNDRLRDSGTKLADEIVRWEEGFARLTPASPTLAKEAASEELDREAAKLFAELFGQRAEDQRRRLVEAGSQPVWNGTLPTRRSEIRGIAYLLKGMADYLPKA